MPRCEFNAFERLCEIQSVSKYAVLRDKMSNQEQSQELQQEQCQNSYTSYIYKFPSPPAKEGWEDFHLIFNVMMVMAARMIDTIQKRMVIFDSWN